jgi:hypothetical protein
MDISINLEQFFGLNLYLKMSFGLAKQLSKLFTLQCKNEGFMKFAAQKKSLYAFGDFTRAK